MGTRPGRRVGRGVRLTLELSSMTKCDNIRSLEFSRIVVCRKTNEKPERTCALQPGVERREHQLLQHHASVRAPDAAPVLQHDVRPHGRGRP